MDCNVAFTMIWQSSLKTVENCSGSCLRQFCFKNITYKSPDTLSNFFFLWVYLNIAKTTEGEILLLFEICSDFLLIRILRHI